MGYLPRPGGYYEQPLALMVQIETIEVVMSAVQHLKRKDAKLTDLTAVQQKLYMWVSN